MRDDIRIQLLEDGIVYLDIGEELVGPCGHSMDEVLDQWVDCDCCEEVFEFTIAA
jgi:hypothetical protein